VTRARHQLQMVSMRSWHGQFRLPVRYSQRSLLVGRILFFELAFQTGSPKTCCCSPSAAHSSIEGRLLNAEPMQGQSRNSRPRPILGRSRCSVARAPDGEQ